MIELNLNGHSVFSPSASEMWLNCSGSLFANAVVRQTEGDSGSPAAAEGTVAHALAEEWLKSGKKPTHRIGEVEKIGEYEIEIDNEMLEYVAEYVAWCNNQEGDKFVEVRVDFSHLTPVPNQTGTADHVCCADGKLTITDLKYGLGVKVSAERNTQLQIYALAVLDAFDLKYDFHEVEIRICQPRLHHFDSWTTTPDELYRFGEYVKERAAAAWLPDAPRTPTEKGCLWCKVKAKCPAKVAEVEAMLDDVFNEETSLERLDSGKFFEIVPEPKELSRKQQERIMAKAKTVRSFLDAVEAELFDYALHGGKLDSYKLVAGRTTRKWADEQAVRDYMVSLGLTPDDFEPRALLSVAQMEKMCKKGGVKAADLPTLVQDRQGKPTLVPISDKRAAWTPDEGIDWDS